jgi:sigma-B regulation protein RsbU (phosphoserine phosphatase)
MKLLFVGLSPSDALQKVLLSNGFDLELVKTASDLTARKSASPDLIALHLKSTAGLKDLKKVRRHNPQAWLAMVIDKAWLRDSDAQNQLLKTEEKDDVWLTETWEGMFWLCFQRMLNQRRMALELREAHEEARLLRANYQELTTSSDRLIEQLERDVGLATSIQRSLLPKVSPDIPGVSIAVKYIPAAGRGGDYYDIFEFGDRKRFGVLMADSKTHGMAAALLSVLLKVRLEEMRDRFPDSRCFVDYLNREIQVVASKELASLSLLYGILDRSSLTFQYTLAGPIKPLLWRRGEPAALSISEDPPLGGIDQYSFRENTIALMPGDLLILHTDGLEAPLAAHESSSFDKIVQILKRRNPSPDPLEVQNELMALVDRYVEKKPLEDDLTLIHFAINERALYVAQAKK